MKVAGPSLLTDAPVVAATEGPSMGSGSAQSSRRSRPLLLLERTMYRDGRTPFTSLFTIRLRGALHEQALRHALNRIQAKHALLRCVVEDAAEGPRFVMMDRPAPIRCAFWNEPVRTNGRPRPGASGWHRLRQAGSRWCASYGCAAAK